MTTGHLSRRDVLKHLAGAVAASHVPVLWSRRAEAAASEIPIGIVVGLTGGAASYGQSVVNASRMIVEEINSRGGIRSKGGARIRLLVADHQTNPRLAGTLVERLVTLQGVLALIGNATSVATIVGSRVADQYQTPMVSTDQGESLTQQGLRYFFQVASKSSDTARSAVEFAIYVTRKAGIHPRRVAVVADDSTFSQDAARGLLRALSELRVDWDMHEPVTYPAGGVADFTAVVQRLKLAGVDLLLQSTLPPNGVQFVRAMKSNDYNPLASIHVAGAPYTPQFRNALGADANYIFNSVGFVPDLAGRIPLAAEFVSKYRERYGDWPDDQAALASEVWAALYDALERAEDLTRPALTQALRATHLAPGANPWAILPGGVAFDQAGDNTMDVPIVMQILDGQQRVVYPFEHATVEPVFPAPKWGERG